MEIDDLKTVWQQQPVDSLNGGEKHAAAYAARARLQKIRRTLLWRDTVETVAALLGILVFGRLLWVVRSGTARTGIALVIAGLILIITMLALARRGNRRRKPQVNVREFFLSESGRIDAQIRLLKSVPWWYLGPVLVGTNVLVVGVSGPGAPSLIFLAATVVLGALIYRLNLQAVRERLLPVKAELARLLVDLSESEQQDVREITLGK